MANCNCCGQKLSWYGTMKSVYHSSTGNPSEKHPFNDDVQEKTKELEADICLLKEQIKSKRVALRQLMEPQEEKKRKQLLKTLHASGISIDELIEHLNNYL